MKETFINGTIITLSSPKQSNVTKFKNLFAFDISRERKD